MRMIQGLQGTRLSESKEAYRNKSSGTHSKEIRIENESQCGTPTAQREQAFKTPAHIYPDNNEEKEKKTFVREINPPEASVVYDLWYIAHQANSRGLHHQQSRPAYTCHGVAIHCSRPAVGKS